MAKHLSDEEIDRHIKGRTTKRAFFLKLKEWMTCKECHAEAYIRLYKYLTESSDIQIVSDVTEIVVAPVPPMLVAEPMVAPVALNQNAQWGAPPVVGVVFPGAAPLFVPQGDIVNAAPVAVPVPAPQPVEVAVDEPEEEEDEVHDDDGGDADVEQDDAPDLNPNE